MSEPCEIKCPWCNATCQFFECSGQLHGWDCGSRLVDEQPKQGRACRLIVRMRSEFHDQLMAGIKYIDKYFDIPFGATGHLQIIARRYGPADLWAGPEKGKAEG